MHGCVQASFVLLVTALRACGALRAHLAKHALVSARHASEIVTATTKELGCSHAQQKRAEMRHCRRLTWRDRRASPPAAVRALVHVPLHTVSPLPSSASDTVPGPQRALVHSVAQSAKAHTPSEKSEDSRVRPAVAAGSGAQPSTRSRAACCRGAPRRASPQQRRTVCLGRPRAASRCVAARALPLRHWNKLMSADSPPRGLKLLVRRVAREQQDPGAR